MSELLKTIEAFNRKERFFLFSYATGNDAGGLRLSDEFRANLGKALGLSIPVEARGYIDYHIDWLHASALLAGGPLSDRCQPNWQPGTEEPVTEPAAPWVSTGSQEDIDLLVCYEGEGVTWLLLVEAKAETGWTNKQVRSKAERLRRIFGSDPIDPTSPIQPRFCLMSPRPPQRLAPLMGEEWPAWMVRAGEGGSGPEFAWLELKVPPGRMKVTGSDADGSPSRNRKFWSVTQVRGPEVLVD